MEETNVAYSEKNAVDAEEVSLEDEEGVRHDALEQTKINQRVRLMYMGRKRPRDKG